jgi:hypothetical protein
MRKTRTTPGDAGGRVGLGGGRRFDNGAQVAAGIVTTHRISVFTGTMLTGLAKDTTTRLAGLKWE